MALNIKKAIKDRGFSVKDVAEKMGIDPITLSYHINGRTRVVAGESIRYAANPSLDVLQRIADAIGCRVVNLFDDDVQHKEQGENKIICPHCGKPISINPSAGEE